MKIVIQRKRTAVLVVSAVTVAQEKATVKTRQRKQTGVVVLSMAGHLQWWVGIIVIRTLVLCRVDKTLWHLLRAPCKR